MIEVVAATSPRGCAGGGRTGEAGQPCDQPRRAEHLRRRRPSRAGRSLWAGLIATELGLAAGVIAGVDAAAFAAAALMAMFAATMAGAMMRGRAGAPCACFGARSTVGAGAVARNLALAAGFARDPVPARRRAHHRPVARPRPRSRAARLRRARRRGPRPRPRGRDAAAAPRPRRRARDRERGPAARRTRRDCSTASIAGDDAELGLAVFSSPGCQDLRGDEADDRVGRPATRCSPWRRFDEHADAGVWRALDVPGSPYAIALDRDGVVLAKGAFNNLAQLESVIATARATPRRPRLDRGARCLNAAPGRSGGRSTRWPATRRAAASSPGSAATMTAVAAGGLVSRAIKPGDADAYHFCGHTYTTGSCPHPAGMPRVDRHGYPLRDYDGVPVDNLGRPVNGRGEPVTSAARRSATRTAGRFRRRRGRRSATRPAASTGSRPRSTAAGTAAAGGRCESSPTAARSTTSGSTATPRSRATATRGARSSASCTTRRRSRAERVALRSTLIGRRAPRRADRDLVAVRVLDDRDDRPAAGTRAGRRRPSRRA